VRKRTPILVSSPERQQLALPAFGRAHEVQRLRHRVVAAAPELGRHVGVEGLGEPIQPFGFAHRAQESRDGVRHLEHHSVLGEHPQRRRLQADALAAGLCQELIKLRPHTRCLIGHARAGERGHDHGALTSAGGGGLRKHQQGACRHRISSAHPRPAQRAQPGDDAADPYPSSAAVALPDQSESLRVTMSRAL
jgi:hypothetical protein